MSAVVLVRIGERVPRSGASRKSGTARSPHRPHRPTGRYGRLPRAGSGRALAHADRARGRLAAARQAVVGIRVLLRGAGPRMAGCSNRLPVVDAGAGDRSLRGDFTLPPTARKPPGLTYPPRSGRSWPSPRPPPETSAPPIRLLAAPEKSGGTTAVQRQAVLERHTGTGNGAAGRRYGGQAAQQRSSGQVHGRRRRCGTGGGRRNRRPEGGTARSDTRWQDRWQRRDDGPGAAPQTTTAPGTGSKRPADARRIQAYPLNLGATAHQTARLPLRAHRPRHHPPGGGAAHPNALLQAHARYV
ncbi:hypothetical protein SGLAM104S_05093 [Streptomyces glaucescens]